MPNSSQFLTAFKQIWNKTDKADLFIPNVLMI